MQPEKRNAFYLIFAYLCAGLGIVGAFLPVLPTTPFLLLAVWAASRGSPELHRWLVEHPRFGPPIVAWEANRAVSNPAKVTACALMAASWMLMYLMTESSVVPWITGGLFVGVAAYLISRPVA